MTIKCILNRSKKVFFCLADKNDKCGIRNFIKHKPYIIEEWHIMKVGNEIILVSVKDMLQ